MIIPVRCYTCSKILSDKYEYYESELLRKKLAMNTTEDPLIININFCFFYLFLLVLFIFTNYKTLTRTYHYLLLIYYNLLHIY